MVEEPNENADAADEQPEAEQPEAEQPEAEQPETEAPEAEQPEAEAPAEPEGGAEEPAEPEAEPAPDAPEPEAEAAAPADQPAKAKDVPPGAELEPIAIEPERELSAEERARLEAEAEERARLEAEAERDEPVARRGPTVELAPDARIQATGKRKNSIARVLVRPGGGEFLVNDRSLDEYFPRQYLRTMARQPLVTTGYEGTVDVRVRVHGGGVSGQAGAVRHGIARALTEIDPELRPELKRRGLLSRDARIKERRKAGLKKARKRPQFSKR
jgi:small subunit ribosomal protein S9